MDDAAVAVGEDLHLDVAGAADVALDEEAAVAEGLLRLAAAGAQAPASSSAASTRRMPRPPPPPAALSRSG